MVVGIGRLLEACEGKGVLAFFSKELIKCIS